ncbi:hybrid sensory kinase in two-component regulatory system with RcsB and YojN [compost metagenome]
MGLAICKKLVELMDGSIWTEKAREGGTDFFFKIPLQLMDTIPRQEYSNEQGVREKREKSEVG